MATNKSDTPDIIPTNPELAISTRQAAGIIGRAEITLHQMRARGEGPRWWKIGRSVRYRLADVLAYRDARTVGGGK